MTDADASERLERLYGHAIETAESLTEASEAEDHETILSLLDELEDVVDELEDVLSTIDLSDLIAAVDWSELPDTVDWSELPEAVEEGDASEAISLQELLEAVDLSEVWDNVNVREFWRQKSELEDEVDDLTDDEDEGLLDTDGDGDGDGDLVDVSMPGTSLGGGSESNDIDPRAIETAIQMQVSESVGVFREKLIEAHEQFEEVRAQNEERFSDRRRNRSRNPTAVSTIPATGPAARSGTTHSTVPAETRHSSAPNRRRIYGPRFDRVEEVTDE